MSSPSKKPTAEDFGRARWWLSQRQTKLVIALGQWNVVVDDLAELLAESRWQGSEDRAAQRGSFDKGLVWGAAIVAWAEAIRVNTSYCPHGVHRQFLAECPECSLDWDDPGVCTECQAPFELVRPGKSQPTCECWNPEASDT